MCCTAPLLQQETHHLKANVCLQPKILTESEGNYECYTFILLAFVWSFFLLLNFWLII